MDRQDVGPLEQLILRNQDCARSVSIVDEQALIRVLKKKQIAGAAIDVFDIEPLPPSHPSGRWTTYWQRRISAT